MLIVILMRCHEPQVEYRWRISYLSCVPKDTRAFFIRSSEIEEENGGGRPFCSHIHWRNYLCFEMDGFC